MHNTNDDIECTTLKDRRSPDAGGISLLDDDDPPTCTREDIRREGEQIAAEKENEDPIEHASEGSVI